MSTAPKVATMMSYSSDKCSNAGHLTRPMQNMLVPLYSKADISRTVYPIDMRFEALERAHEGQLQSF